MPSQSVAGSGPVRQRPVGIQGILLELWKNKILYLMMLPACALLLMFNYMPLFGLTLVFKDFDYGMGIFGSPMAKPWYNNFIFLFQNEGTFRAVRNTLIINVYFIVFNTAISIVLAILLNEVTHMKIKRITQSFTLLPYFISVIVISVFIYQLFSSDNGMINSVLKNLGLQPVLWYEKAQYWRVIMTAIYVWKNCGYTSVIYLSTITGIDETLFEAAQIDGANRFNRITRITIPLLTPTMITLGLLAVGRIMNSDFGLFYAIIGDNPLLYNSVDVLDTFIYRNLRKIGDFTMAGAASLIQSVMAAIILSITNFLARRYDQAAALF